MKNTDRLSYQSVDALKAKLSILIPYYRKEETIEAVLSSINPAVYEILLCCDGCPPPNLTFPNLRILENDKNLGLSATRNRLVREARTPFLLFLDADCALLPDSLDSLLANWDQKSLFGGQEIPFVTNNTIDKFRIFFWRQTLGEKPQNPAPFLMGLCCGGKKQDFLEITFDENLKTHAEDLDFSFRAMMAKKNILYIPELKVHHLRKDNLKTIMKMIQNHTHYQGKILIRYNLYDPFMILQALKWIFISAGSSLKRHKSFSLFACSVFLTSWAFLCRLVFDTIYIILKNHNDSGT